MIQLLVLIPFLWMDRCTCNNATKLVTKTTTLRTLYTTDLAATSTSSVLLTDTVLETVTSVSTLPPWTSTVVNTTETHTITETLVSSATRIVTRSQQVSLLLQFAQTTTITIPTSTAGVTKTLNLEAETTTQSVTVSTIPVTTAASLLFCYNFI